MVDSIRLSWVKGFEFSGIKHLKARQQKTSSKQKFVPKFILLFLPTFFSQHSNRKQIGETKKKKREETNLVWVLQWLIYCNISQTNKPKIKKVINISNLGSRKKNLKKLPSGFLTKSLLSSIKDWNSFTASSFAIPISYFCFLNLN